jgi:hypothetical protein
VLKCLTLQRDLCLVNFINHGHPSSLKASFESEYVMLELSRAWEPSYSSRTSPAGEGEEAQNSVSHGNYAEKP